MSPNDLVLFFLEIAVMLSAALLFGWLARRLGFPAVLGELIGGIFLGPTVFGGLVPGLHGWLFPDAGLVRPGVDALVQVCLLFFLFAVGLEMNLRLIDKRRYSIAWTSLMGIALPFALGVAAVILLPGLWSGHVHGSMALFALFMGTALSISALPVIARTLMDLDLMMTDTAAIIMGAATLNDLIGWSFFAFILGSFAPDGVPGLPPYITFILALLFFGAMLTAGRAAGQKVQAWLKSHSPWPGTFPGVAGVSILLAAAVAQAIGIHAVFGAFLTGIAFSQCLEKRNEAHEMIYQFVMAFFAPLYFVSVGLRANFIASFDPALVLLVLLIACAGKIIGATLGARVGGLPARQAAAVGFALNARGAMEMILATVAKDAGIIDDSIFVALIIMALATSVLSGPAIGRLNVAGAEKLVPRTVEPYRRMADFEAPVEED